MSEPRKYSNEWWKCIIKEIDTRMDTAQSVLDYEYSQRAGLDLIKYSNMLEWIEQRTNINIWEIIKDN